MEKLLWVCLGGAVGSGARFLVSGWALRALGGAFPYGTFAVNFLGSMVLAGLMHGGLTGTGLLSPNVRVALTTGLMGGFTTYSTFSYETYRYLEEGAWPLAATNIALTVLACLVGCWLGVTGSRWLLGSSLAGS